MKSFLKGLFYFLGYAACHSSVADIERRIRTDFDAIVPTLMQAGWPIPVTDEGKLVCLELMSDCYLY